MENGLTVYLMEQHVIFNTELIKRYDIAGPRYTSYPTAVQFMEGFDAEAYRRYTTASNNAAFGYQSLGLNSTGTQNSAFGAWSLDANTTAPSAVP